MEIPVFPISPECHAAPRGARLSATTTSRAKLNTCTWCLVRTSSPFNYNYLFLLRQKEVVVLGKGLESQNWAIDTKRLRRDIPHRRFRAPAISTAIFVRIHTHDCDLPNGATTEKSRKIAIEGKRWKVQKDTSHDSSTNRKQRCSAFEELHRAAILDRTTRYSSTDETTKGKMVLFV